MINFKVLYKEWLERNGGISGAANESMNYYKSSGDKSLTTYDYKEKTLIPGSFFIFEYYDVDKLAKFRAGKSEMPYYDARPVIISLGVDESGMEIGFNLNVILPVKRLLLLSTMFRLFEKVYLHNLEMGKQYKKWRKIPLSSEFIIKAAKLKNNIAINKYDRKKMRKIQLVSWDSIVILSTLYLKFLMPNKKKKLTYQALLNMSL